MSKNPNPPNWSTSDAKLQLTKMINDGSSKIHTTMTFDELYKMEAFRVFKRENFRRNTGRLYEQITGNKKVWPKAKESKSKEANATRAPKNTKKKVEPWKNSLAKAFLLKLLTDSSKPINGMTSREVYDSHAVFQDYPFDRFKDNLKSLKDQVKNDNMWAEIEMVQIQQDMKQTKNKKVTIRGYPFWHKHKAKGLLTADVKSGKLLIIILVCVGNLDTNFKYKTGKADTMKPKELWNTRKEYKEFPLDVFRNHVHQEKRAQRESPYWIVKRNNKGLKKHNAHVKELRKEWYESRGKGDQLLTEMMNDLKL